MNSGCECSSSPIEEMRREILTKTAPENTESMASWPVRRGHVVDMVDWLVRVVIVRAKLWSARLCGSTNGENGESAGSILLPTWMQC